MKKKLMGRIFSLFFAVLIVGGGMCSLPAWADEAEAEGETATEPAADTEAEGEAAAGAEPEASPTPTQSPRPSPAAATAVIPEPGKERVVLDEAEILSEETEKAIIDANKALGEKGEIVVVTVKTTGDISLADFTAKIYEKWAIGTAETRTGVLQVLDVGSDYYYTMVGPGYAKIFPEATVLSLNKDNLEDGFSQKNYDAGVTKMVAAYAKKIADAPAEDVPTAKKEEGGFWSAVWGFIKVVLLIIVILLVLAVGFFILVNVRAQKRRKQRRSAGRTGSGRTTGRTTGRTPQERTGRRR